MPNVREQFPEYDDMADHEFGHAMHQKFYQDMPKEEFQSKTGLLFSEDNHGNIGPGFIPQAAMDMYHAVRDTMEFKGKPSDNPNIGANVATMGANLAGAGLPMAEKGAIGAVGGRLPPSLGDKQKELIRSLAAEDNHPKEIARILTAYYTSPGVRVTEDHVKDILKGTVEKGEAIPRQGPQFYKSWNDEKQQYVEELLKSGMSRTEAQHKFNEKYPDSPITQGSRFLRMEQAQRAIDLDNQTTKMVTQLKDAHKELSANQPK